MRPLVVGALLGVTAGLTGCGSTPPDPYRDMRMLTPEEVGVKQQAQDPVQEAEKAYNAKFTRTNQPAR